MATHNFYLDAIEPGRNPYYSFKSAFLNGNDLAYLWAGDYLDQPNVWEVVACSIALVTDATVANRVAKLDVFGPDGVDAVIMSLQSGNIAASSSEDLNLTPLSALSTGSATLYDYYASYSIPVPLVGKHGKIYARITNGVAGDQYKLSATVKFKNHELGMTIPGQLYKPELKNIYGRIY